MCDEVLGAGLGIRQIHVADVLVIENFSRAFEVLQNFVYIDFVQYSRDVNFCSELPVVPGGNLNGIEVTGRTQASLEYFEKIDIVNVGMYLFQGVVGKVSLRRLVDVDRYSVFSEGVLETP